MSGSECMHIPWNLSIVDTIGTKLAVLYRLDINAATSTRYFTYVPAAL